MTKSKKAMPNAHTNLLDFPCGSCQIVVIVFVYKVHPAKRGFMIPVQFNQTAILQFWEKPTA